MATRYMDWADWAGDHHEEVEAERWEEARKKLEQEVVELQALVASNPKTLDERLADLRNETADFSCAIIVGYTRTPDCEHTEVDNQGVCENCGDEVEGWEPDERQLDQHNGTSVAA